MNVWERARHVIDWRFGVLGVAALLLGWILTHPVLKYRKDLHRYVLVFDITQSMYVEDKDVSGTATSRLDYAKRTAITALQRLPCGSEVGLGIFTQHRTFLLFTPVELCEHFSELTKMIHHLDWRMAWRFRSEVAKGLYSALQIADQLDQDSIVAFITDGHEAPPIHPELRPRFPGTSRPVKGLLIGVGGERPAPIPRLDYFAQAPAYWRADEVMQVDPYSQGRVTGEGLEVMTGIDADDLQTRIENGVEHLASLREPYLKQLAGELGLGYLRLESGETLSARLLDQDFAYQQSTDSDIRAWLGLFALLLIMSGFVPSLIIRK